MQKAVNFILILMSPTAPPPFCLHPQPHHLPHAHYHYLLECWKLKNWKRMWFEMIYFTTRGSDRFWNLNWFSTETTEYFSTIFMHPFLYVVTNNLAKYQFLTLRYYGRIEGNTYISRCSVLFTMFENHTWTKPSSKECVMKISKSFQLQNAECINR